ncbi:ankyrin repeat domain-containing protein [Stieleria sp. JC731]|uniref:ankyrin repeat domain-containing protein n=1 Tax=Pirellulaceae TaxID=2691357 RepID=UPI001E3D755A|nr:ankyrin repeat domain-containing protein [Stieleria sp. JC731]MCC9602261.1 ankyrin repeat domain-containing protein [Stieleria sp. JC731]
MNRAVKQGDLAEVDRLLASGATVNGTGANGMTPLMTACAAGDIAAVRHLISLGADVNGCSKYRSALMLAAETGHADIVQLLLLNGVDTDWTNFRSEDAYSIAVNRRFTSIVDLLDRK